jgi:hypothetical protein
MAAEAWQKAQWRRACKAFPVGCKVELLAALQTKGGTKFAVGEVLVVTKVWKGQLDLANELPPPNSKSIRRVYPGSVRKIE